MLKKPQTDFYEAQKPRWRWLTRLRPTHKDGTPRSLGVSDMIVTTGGIALGVACALFPWYVFFNQDQFGVRAMKFSGDGEASRMPASLNGGPQRIARPITPGEIPRLELDLFATGTVPPQGRALDAAGAAEQPFPGKEPTAAHFKLLHVENGRGMMEDEDGIWLVQVGSKLPDGSRVNAFQKRGGGWAILTDRDTVISAAQGGK